MTVLAIVSNLCAAGFALVILYFAINKREVPLAILWAVSLCLLVTSVARLIINSANYF